MKEVISNRVCPSTLITEEKKFASEQGLEEYPRANRFLKRSVEGEEGRVGKFCEKKKKKGRKKKGGFADISQFSGRDKWVPGRQLSGLEGGSKDNSHCSPEVSKTGSKTIGLTTQGKLQTAKVSWNERKSVTKVGSENAPAEAGIFTSLGGNRSFFAVGFKEGLAVGAFKWDKAARQAGLKKGRALQLACKKQLTQRPKTYS